MSDYSFSSQSGSFDLSLSSESAVSSLFDHSFSSDPDISSLFDLSCPSDSDEDMVHAAFLLAEEQENGSSNKYESTNSAFDFESHPESRCDEWFRFLKEDIRLLADLLGMHQEWELDNGSKFSCLDGFAIFLYRLSHMDNFVTMEGLFGHDGTKLCRIFNAVLAFLYAKCEAKTKFDTALLTAERIQLYEQAVSLQDVPIRGCWAFIDGTVNKCARPVGEWEDQRALFNGHKRAHGLNYQGLATPDGLLVSFCGPYAGPTHDQLMLAESALLDNLEALQYPHTNTFEYYVFGDKGYENVGNVLSSFRGNTLTMNERAFNLNMSKLRICVEWAFQKVKILFKILGKLDTQRLQLSPVAAHMRVAVFLANCHTCFYQSQTSSYFDCDPPSIQEYLSGI